ncbi:transcriptional regulator, TetR family [Aliiroseovarius sediminilitoris]|uniref:Transcriptional regulator, TetR family n=1 Tax=Aliiroseovarius sediminilitoris TaxID=1173584 RepID=A0A1I0QI23_9RHOB|nr:TetR family transcriptional regulator C-terminal domain-containing protein [Aliiroseovarius sediminilitoris]SEW26822.1 transcriptional regulator, TetR family [Aliiroseovarius sediminilitoris]
MGTVNVKSDVNRTTQGIQSRNREEVTARILVAAEKVFAEFGYAGASISRIAASAGIPKSNVVYYFETKEALYRRVVGEIFDIWRAAADSITVDNNPIQALGEYIDTKLDLARTRPYGSKVWANEIIQRAPIVQDYLEDELRSWTENRITVIEAWIENGQIRPISARHLLYAIWATTQHYADFTHQITTLNDGVELSDAQWKDTKTAVKDLLLRGVALPNRDRG